MLASQTDSKHLAPLLEFIRYLRNLRTHVEGRLPRRLNGPSQFTSLPFPRLSFSLKEDKLEGESSQYVDDFSEGNIQSPEIEAKSNSTSVAPSEEDEKEIQPLKRMRIKEEPSGFVLLESSCLPMEYQLMSKGTQKGVYMAKFVDLDLSVYGLTPLKVADRVDKKFAKLAMGERCCYLLLGTSLIVTGVIVAVDIKEEKMQVSPDRGLNTDVEWIEMFRLYEIPVDLESVQRSVTAHIKKTMDNALSESKS
ncbi:unnamed protein product [Phytomonas sp. EM1]|nr:unnamed protein product [Phytomonas sp. EM1]|eukprot:CCW64031.1 unnamed protein product [Phytomonas sp. isolate EM1]